MRLIRRTLFLFLAGSWLIGFPVHGDTEEVPLHQRIDAVLEHAQIGASAELASDEDFVRRVYLNLFGRSPRAEETKNFLADSEANKRVQLIDDLFRRAHPAVGTVIRLVGIRRAVGQVAVGHLPLRVRAVFAADKNWY